VRALLDQLRADGFKVVQLRWDANWIKMHVATTPERRAWPAGRPTAFKWIHDIHFVPLGIERSTNGRCGSPASTQAGLIPVQPKAVMRQLLAFRPGPTRYLRQQSESSQTTANTFLYRPAPYVNRFSCHAAAGCPAH